MKNEFIPYEQALALKELGFDEPCFGRYNPDNDLIVSHTETYNTDFRKTLFTQAPTFQQAFRWFREKYGKCSYVIETTDKYNQLDGGYQFGISNLYYDIYNSHEEAELACLIKLIEIVKQK